MTTVWIIVIAVYILSFLITRHFSESSSEGSFVFWFFPVVNTVISLSHLSEYIIDKILHSKNKFIKWFFKLK